MRPVTLATSFAAVVAALCAVTANAAVLCPDVGGPGIRQFRLDTGAAAAQCWDYGAGNVPNKTHGPNQDVFIGAPTFDDGLLHLPSGFSLLDKSGSGGDPFEGMLTGSNDLTSGRSGTFSIDGDPASQYLIIFKTGVAARNPDWVAFLLSAGTLSGSWSFNGSQSLSHAAIYGGTRDDPAVVPIPAAVWLLGSGLLGLLGLGRRGRKSGTIAAA